MPCNYVHVNVKCLVLNIKNGLKMGSPVVYPLVSMLVSILRTVSPIISDIPFPHYRDAVIHCAHKLHPRDLYTFFDHSFWAQRKLVYLPPEWQVLCVVIASGIEGMGY